MINLFSHLALASVLLMSPKSTAAGNLRGRVAFNSKLLKIAVTDWLQNATTACLKYGGHISEWDTSRVYNMSGLFANSDTFNDDVSRWDVSNVRDFRYTFSNASSFRGDLSSWDTSNTVYMQHMFHGASSFNSDLSGWNTTSVLNFANMFAGAFKFNGNVSSFDVTSSYDLSFMFYKASSFNQDVSDWTREDAIEPGSFRVKWIQNMQSMFEGASSFQGSGMSEWQTFAVWNMNSMFKDTPSFSGDLSNWNVKNVKDFREMFEDSAFNTSLCWDIQPGANTTDMFIGTLASISNDCNRKEKQRKAPEVELRSTDSISSATLRSPLSILGVLLVALTANTCI